MIAFISVFLGLVILMLIPMILGTFILKIIEQVTHGRLKFFNRDYLEPVFSKEPRDVEFF